MTRKLNVAILIDAWFPFFGGGQVHVRELTKRMTTDCEFTIYHSKSSGYLQRTLWSIKVIFELINDHQEKKFDLIHAHAYISGIPAKALSLFLNIPVVFTVHGCNILDLNKLNKKRKNAIKFPIFKYHLEKLLLTGISYDRQISVTNHFLQYKNINKKITVIPNGVDVNEFDKIIKRKRRQFTIIYVGRDDYIKGREYLIKALTTIKKKFSGIKLVEISKGEKTGKSLIKEYKKSHLFVLPSLSEGHPLTMLEAWAANLPVIVTNVGDNAKMVKQSLNGYLVPPGDSEALITAILKAYNNPDLEALGKEGYNLVKEKYSWEKAAKKTLKVYKEVINAAR